MKMFLLVSLFLFSNSIYAQNRFKVDCVATVNITPEDSKEIKLMLTKINLSDLYSVHVAELKDLNVIVEAFAFSDFTVKLSAGEIASGVVVSANGLVKDEETLDLEIDTQDGSAKVFCKR